LNCNLTKTFSNTQLLTATSTDRGYKHGRQSEAAVGAFAIAGMLLFFVAFADAQVVSPVEGGHYSPAVANIRDRATPPPGLFVLWYNVYATSNTYIDKDGNEFNSIRLDQIYPGLPTIGVSLDLNAFASIPNVFWASHFRVLGGGEVYGGSLLQLRLGRCLGDHREGWHHQRHDVNANG